MISTIRASPPSWGTIVPTSRPSRSTVARSQTAITSARRWVMKRTERPLSRRARITSNTRSARSDGSAAVISSRIRSCGSWVRARARSSMRRIGSGRSPTSSRKLTPRSIAASCVRTASTEAPVRRRFWATVRSGTSAGSWNTGDRPSRAACMGERARVCRPATEIVPVSARVTPVRHFTSVLLPAPFAPRRACTSPVETDRSTERSATTGP